MLSDSKILARRATLALTGRAVLTALSLIALLWLLGYRVNLTHSLPPGIWRIYDTEKALEKGDYILIDTNKLPVREQEVSRYFKRNAFGKYPHLLKIVAGVSGDIVEEINGYIAINGAILSEGKVRKKDSLGEELRPFPLPRRLGVGEVWAMSRNNGYDSRYVGPVSRDTVVGCVRPVWLWE